jgi:hypothetical protein
MPKLTNFKFSNCNYRSTTVRTVMKFIPKVSLGPIHMCKNYSPIFQSYRKLWRKNEFWWISKISESSHGNRCKFPETQNFAPKIWNLMYLRSIKIPAKFEPNWKYAWEHPARPLSLLTINNRSSKNKKMQRVKIKKKSVEKKWKFKIKSEIVSQEKCFLCCFWLDRGNLFIIIVEIKMEIMI